ncbi:hypothetical protein E4U55_006698 [Claviceps digitariae]|nr:hypothetical protein E4U55_006698 [Claviceps digitariae]
MDISSFPIDVWNIIIEQLVITVGIRNAVLLRTTSKAFDAAITRAICVSQVVHINDRCTPFLSPQIGPSLRGRIALVKSRTNLDVNQDFLVVIDNVNRKLDIMTGVTDEVTREEQHLAIAETVSSVKCTGYSTGKGYDSKWDLQNLFCGAVVIGDLSLVKTMLEEQRTSKPPIKLNGLTPYFSRPLVIAAGRGWLDIVRYLMEKGCSDFICRCKKPYKCVHRQNQRRYEEKVGSQSFSFAFEVFDSAVPTALRAAILGQHKDVLRELLVSEHRLPLLKVGYASALIVAARAGIEFVHMLVDLLEGAKLADISYYGLGEQMLWTAIRYGRKDVVQMLFDEGFVGVNQDLSAPSAYCWRPLDFKGPLQWAAYVGKTDIMRFLLDRGADIHLNGSQQSGRSPIEAAAAGGHLAALEMLLDVGADPKMAFRIAIEESQPRITKFLLDRYPYILDKVGGDFDGDVALWYAVARKNLRNIKLLVDHGVSLNDGHQEPWQIPLNVAKDGKGQWVVDYLLSLGAQDTDAETLDKEAELLTAQVLVTERTWQWVSRY